MDKISYENSDWVVWCFFLSIEDWSKGYFWMQSNAIISVLPVILNAEQIQFERRVML